MRCLLDKSVARRLVEALSLYATRQPLSAEHDLALQFLVTARRRGDALLIVPPTHNVLELIAAYSPHAIVVRRFLATVDVLSPMRYTRRWARRLRDFGFTREDAAVLALGTFGSVASEATLGAACILTLDQPMHRNWATRFGAIAARFEAMQADLTEGYRGATLPRVLLLDSRSLVEQ